jgi:hypothetical protein
MVGEKAFFINFVLGNLQTLFALPVRIAGGLKEKKSSTHPTVLWISKAFLQLSCRK